MSKILLIDDDPSAVSFLIYELEEEYKHHVTMIKNANDALEALLESQYDAVILDIMMPIPESWGKEDKQKAELGLSTGAVLFEKIRAKRTNLPILIYSAKIGNISLDNYTSYLRKPESIRTIVNQLNDLINK